MPAVFQSHSKPSVTSLSKRFFCIRQALVFMSTFSCLASRRTSFARSFNEFSTIWRWPFCRISTIRFARRNKIGLPTRNFCWRNTRRARLRMSETKATPSAMKTILSLLCDKVCSKSWLMSSSWQEPKDFKLRIVRKNRVGDLAAEWLSIWRRRMSGNEWQVCQNGEDSTQGQGRWKLALTGILQAGGDQLFFHSCTFEILSTFNASDRKDQFSRKALQNTVSSTRTT